MPNLPAAQPEFERHADESSDANASRIADTCCSETELAVRSRYVVRDFRKRAHIHKSTEQTFPENYGKDGPYVRDEVEERMQGEDHKVDYLQQRR